MANHGIKLGFKPFPLVIGESWSHPRYIVVFLSREFFLPEVSALLLFIVATVIKPVNLYFASVSGLEVKPLGVDPGL